MPQFKASQNSLDDETKLHLLLEAQYTYKQLRMVRYGLIQLLAIVGVLVWLVAYWPSVFPAQLYAFAGALFGVLLACLIVTSVREWQWYRRRGRYVAEGYDKRAGVEVHL